VQLATETALLSLASEIYSAVGRSEITFLTLYDVYATFYMVDHDILLERLETSNGLRGLPISWFRSYLSGRSQMIITSNSRTQWVHARLGVYQGSVLGPLYALYSGQSYLFLTSGAAGHLFADDVQAFLMVPHLPIYFWLLEFSLSLIVIHSWMSSHLLNLNASKIQFIWFDTPQQLQELDFAFLSEQFQLISFSSSVRDLGVTTDSSLTFAGYISNLTCSSYFHFRRLRLICRSVSSSIIDTSIHAFICSRIDYCNSLLIGFLRFVSLQFR